MNHPFLPQRLHIPSFAEAGEALSGVEPLERFQRLATALKQPVDFASARPVRWHVQAAMRSTPGHGLQPWLFLDVEAFLPLECQRCTMRVDERIHVQRGFRFVADEATAEWQDGRSEEDVLALDTRFDLYGLIEDELLLALPLVPRHTDGCPVEMQFSAQDADFGAAPQTRRHPFAALDVLKKKDAE